MVGLWVDKSLNINKAEKTYLGLGEVDISYIRDRSDITLVSKNPTISAADCREHLVKSLSIPPVRDVESSIEPGNVLRLDLAITEMSPGAYLFRGLHLPLFFLGLGHAYVQVEGIVSDTQSGRPLVKFVERRRHSGLLAKEDWWPTKTKFEKTMVGTLLSEASYNILHELKALFVRQ